MTLLRLAVVRDYAAEGWRSMDLCAEQLLRHLPADVAACEVAPPFRRLLGRCLPAVRLAFNADRALNRYLLLPRVVRRAARAADFVHVVDHSYAHVVHAVPDGRAGVYCHDLHAFKCLLAPQDTEPRPWWFRRLMRHVLTGLQRAAVVFTNSQQTTRQLIEHRLVAAERVVHVPLGVAEEYRPEASGAVSLPGRVDFPFLLHVGNNVPRKRLDVLLDVFAAVQRSKPELRLIQIGGPWPEPLRRRIHALKISDNVIQWQNLTRMQLAELYRRAAAVLVTSEQEGFGLPVIEALASGAVVIASDIPALREAGGAAVLYCPVADVQEWSRTVAAVLNDPNLPPPPSLRLQHAAQFSWQTHAERIAAVYRSLAEGLRPR